MGEKDREESDSHCVTNGGDIRDGPPSEFLAVGAECIGMERGL
jgi:hypothetical protein